MTCARGSGNCRRPMPPPPPRPRRARRELTKPPGALGRLEELALWLAAWQGRALPRLERVAALVFAGNHGVAARGVSAYPSAVTAQMVANFEAGGAAINQLCRTAGADAPRRSRLALDQPTADFCTGPAMSEDECVAALNAGIGAVAADLDLLALGEMGIGNTASAAAICAALFGGPGGLVDRARHRPRPPRSRPQDRGGRPGPRAPCRRLRRPARDPAPPRRARDRGARRRAARRARAAHPGAARRLRRPAPRPRCSRRSRRPRSTTPGRRTARPSPAIRACSSASACARCCRSTCASAKPPAPRSRSCSAAPPSPATTTWRPSPAPASAVARDDARA